MFSLTVRKTSHTLFSFLRRAVFALVMIELMIANVMCSSVYAQRSEDIITQIRVTGLRSLTKDYVLSKIRSREGNYFYPSTVKDDIKRLYATGHFSMINMETQKKPAGVVLLIKLQEKPILMDIEFSGVHKLKEKELKDVMKSTVGSPADEGRIKQDIMEIAAKYVAKGYPLAEVNYQLNIVSEKNEASLKVIVDEGERLKVKKIVFEGINAFSASQLQRLMKTKKESIWPLNALLKTGILDEEVFAQDLDRLENFYHYKGYLDAKIAEVKRNVVAKKDKIEIVIVIEEGPTYNVGEVELSGNAVFPTRSLRLLLKSLSGTIYSPEKLGKDVEAIKDFYFNRGYIDAKVSSKVTFAPDTSMMNLVFRISEGEIYYVKKVDIQGNYKTKDKVIRRELVVYPGEIFNGNKIKTSQRRLENTGFFEKVAVKMDSADESDRKNLIFDVEEKKTGALSFGAGFSSIDSFVGFVEISQSNFDLFNFKNFQGAGQKFRIRFEGGDERQNFLLSFVEPYLFDKKLVFGFDTFIDRSEFLSSDYDEDHAGVSFRLGKALGNFNRGDVILTLENIDVKVDGGASEQLLDEDGSYDQVSVGFKFVRDTRDRILIPTRGARTLAMVKIAGGTESYVRFDLRHNFYITPFSRFPDHILQFKNGLGVVSTSAPIFDRMFLGGANTIRGFEYREVGPQDINDEPLGGKLMVWQSLEYLFPIIDRVYGAFFIDGGNAYESVSDFGTDTNVGIGLGLRLNLPIGPIRLDYGFPIVTDDFTDDAKPRFHFGMGTSY